jgi:ribosomal protein L13E
MIAFRPKVLKRNRKQRSGKGFSKEEVKKAGIASLRDALKLGVPVDSRRGTVYAENVEAVKAFLESKKAESEASKARVKRKRKSKS